jgi:hypothetical protein
MRKLRSQSWFTGGFAAIAGLIIAATGCQMGPTRSNETATSQVKDIPGPFFPKQLVHLFPSKTEVEYSLTDEAQAARVATAQDAAAAAGVDRLAATSGAK